MRGCLFPVPFVLWIAGTIIWFIAAYSGPYDTPVHLVRDGVGVTRAPDLVKLERVPFPWCDLCGYERVGETVLEKPTLRSGTWIYRTPDQTSLALAFNSKTGEVLS